MFTGKGHVNRVCMALKCIILNQFRYVTEVFSFIYSDIVSQVPSPTPAENNIILPEPCSSAGFVVQYYQARTLTLRVIIIS